VFTPSAPLLSTAKLAASLEARGMTDVEQVDLNLRCFEYYASKPVFGQVLERLAAKISGDVFKGAAKASAIEHLEIGHRLVDEVATHFDLLRDAGAFEDRARFLEAAEGFKRFVDILNFAFAVKWSWTKCGQLNDIQTFEQVRSLQSSDANPFVPYFDRELRNGLVTPDTGLVGISISFWEQLLPALTLAWMIKQRSPETMIAMGGGTVSWIKDYIARDRTFFDYADAYVLDEGEVPLHALIDSLGSGHGIPDVTNLLRAEGEQIVGEYRCGAYDFEHLTPSFDGLPLERYLLPRIVLPVTASSNCYYGKCSFCTHTTGRARYTRASVDQVAGMLFDLSERYGARDFYFCDNSMTPALVRQLSTRLLEAKADFRWFGDMLVAPSLTQEDLTTAKRAGLLSVYVGFESFNDRLLEILGKSQTRAQALAFWDKLRAAGIAAKVNMIVGVPSQTEAEVIEDLETARKHICPADVAAPSILTVAEHTPMFEHPERYGIQEILPRKDPASFRPMREYRTEPQLSEEWLQERLAEYHRDVARQMFLPAVILLSRYFHFAALPLARPEHFRSGMVAVRSKTGAVFRKLDETRRRRPSSATMTKQAPIEDYGALPIDERRKGDSTTWSIWYGNEMLGGVVLKELDAESGEGKLLFVASAHQKKGIGRRLADHVLEQARLRKYKWVYLETGATDEFAPARKLFAELGFEECGPFGEYGDNPYSRYMRLEL